MVPVSGVLSIAGSEGIWPSVSIRSEDGRDYPLFTMEEWKTVELLPLPEPDVQPLIFSDRAEIELLSELIAAAIPMWQLPLYLGHVVSYMKDDHEKALAFAKKIGLLQES